jgi:spermidine/putrescine transport system substrate-binding protein
VRTLRALTWPGMPACESLQRAARCLDVHVVAEAVASNELLLQRMEEAGPFDVVFPCDYAVERLRGAGRLRALDRDRLPLQRLARWAREAAHDPGCTHSVPFAFGTTGYMHDSRLGPASSWRALLNPADGARVGMLGEVREVIGAALLAAGRSPNATDADSLDAAHRLLRAQKPHVARYDSDDFVTPMLEGTVVAQHAWSGPAALAMRECSWLDYVVPDEGALLWVTTAAIPLDAPDPAASLALIAELMDPELAAITTRWHGYATPNDAALELLQPALRDDRVLFPSPTTLARCHAARDLGEEEQRMVEVFRAVRDGADV